MPMLGIEAIGSTEQLSSEKCVIYGSSRAAVLAELLAWMTARTTHGPCDVKCYFRDAVHPPEDAYQCIVVYDVVPTEDTL